MKVHKTESSFFKKGEGKGATSRKNTGEWARGHLGKAHGEYQSRRKPWGKPQSSGPRAKRRRETRDI